MSGHLENSAVATGLEKVSFHFNPKEGQCQRMFKLPQLGSLHMLVRLYSKALNLSFSSSWTENIQMYKLGFEETEESEIKLPTSTGSWRKQGSSRKTSASLTTWKLWLRITTNCGKFLKRWEYQTTLPVSWEICMWVKKQQNQTQNNRLVRNWERSRTRLYTVPLLI